MKRYERVLVSLITLFYKLIMHFVERTSTVSFLGCEEMDKHLAEGGNGIWAFWHQDVLLAPQLSRSRKIVALVSPSHDGQILAYFLQKFGFQIIYGSSRKFAKESVQEMLAFLQKERGWILAISCDGPLGPPLQAKKGPVLMASLTGTPIYPLAFSCRRGLRLPTWDRTIFPSPFNHLVLSVGAPFTVASDISQEELETARQLLEAKIMEQVERAKAHLKK